MLGTSSEEVSELASAGAKALRKAGFVVHEEETSKGNIQVLGWEFESTRMRPKSQRVWRVRLAMQQLLRSGAANGRQLEKVIGHANFFHWVEEKLCPYLGRPTLLYSVIIMIVIGCGVQCGENFRYG